MSKIEICVGTVVRLKTVPNYTQVTLENGVVTRYGYWDVEGEDGPVGATYWYVRFPVLGELRVDQSTIQIVSGGRTWVAEKKINTTRKVNGVYVQECIPGHWEPAQ